MRGCVSVSRVRMRLLAAVFALVVLLFWLAAESASATVVRVCLQSGVTTAEFSVISGEYAVHGGGLSAGAAAVLCSAEADDVIKIVRGSNGSTVYLNGQKQGVAANDVSLLADSDAESIIKYGKTEYRGSMSVLQNGYVLNVLDMEQYLYGVVGREIGYQSPVEALRAQAIVARSYAAFSMEGRYYDVSASTASQVYGGYTAETESGGERIVSAVDDTEGLVMYYDGELVEAVFCSSAGGHTENNENVWGGVKVPYLRGVESPYDADYHSMNWEVSLSASDLAELAVAQMKRTGQSGSFGKFVRLDLSYQAADGGRTASGRVTEASIIGTGATVSAQYDAIRTMLGVKSTLFELSGDEAAAYDEVYVLNAAGNVVQRPWSELVAMNAEGITLTLGDLTQAYMRSAAGLYSLNGLLSSGQTDGVTLIGSGWGHGVGMSQNGAIGMAEDGYDAEDILRHYYGGENAKLLKIKTLAE